MKVQATVMDTPISEVDLVRHVSRVLDEVRHGTSFTVTAYGEPVARIVPASPNEAAEQQRQEADVASPESQPALDTGVSRPWKTWAESTPEERERNFQELLERARSQPALNLPITWKREDLYER